MILRPVPNGFNVQNWEVRIDFLDFKFFFGWSVLFHFKFLFLFVPVENGAKDVDL